MAFFTSFYKIWFPAEVVFDEVHFGKFAGFYIQRLFFFDVHPPLAKIMFGLVGYLVGFDGNFRFRTIGESYVENQVPYIGLRAFAASLHVMSIALVYNILKESGYSILTCFVTAALYLLDNAFIAQNRLILLDSVLIFYMLTAIYSYVRFSKHRHVPFTAQWWKWLVTTGVCMALTLSVKMVGLFVIGAIGIAVIIDLWNMLDIENNKTMNELLKHFGARVFGLIIVPATVYLFWFYVHFAVVNQSGPGDVFMSAQFQNTLKNSPLRLITIDIHYNDAIRLQHKGTKAILHSHDLQYPLRYEDGRVSSKGQQVTGTLKPDNNSYWRILPTMELKSDQVAIRHNEVIRLQHTGTGRYLLTRDVAAPLIPSNQEFSAVDHDVRYNDTLFRVVLDDFKNSNKWMTHMKQVKLIHINTGVALWCNDKTLPDWGLGHKEVNGNKKAKETRNYWIATEVQGKNATEINIKKKEKMKDISFFKKFIELQMLMFKHNAKITAPHPYQSTPYSWPLMLRGISYWTNHKTKSQIYMTGNIASWWIGTASIFIFSFISLFEKMARKRGIKLIKQETRIRMTRSGGFFLLLWACHYLPFIVMGRTLFLHHYLPAMACNYLLLGALFEFLFIDGVHSPISKLNTKAILFSSSKIRYKSWIAAIVLLGMQFSVYLFLSPITYGTSGLSIEQANRRKVLDSWDLQYGK
ncbi:glycosyltransferase family 39 protein, partial [Backusella circina FSU 941]